ncbi:hypothetical protein PFISCL1PPCAC_25017, partial [Pristionchus fissidentatus]
MNNLQGGKVAFKNKQGQTALHITVKACRVENVEVMDFLDKVGIITVEAIDRLSLNTSGIGEKSSINWKTHKGNTALHHAARGGNLEIVKALCRHPYINYNIKNSEGLCPLVIAASRGHYECVEDALIHAAINGQTKIVALLLKSNRANHDTQDKYLNSAMHYACAYGWLPIVKLLTEV